MRNNAVMNLIMDDVVFHDRNKAYGAYLLRRGYDQNMNKGIFIGIAIYLLLLCSPLVAKLFKKEAFPLELNVIPIEFDPYFDKKANPPPLSPRNRTPLNKDPIMSVYPPVVKDSLTAEEVLPITEEELMYLNTSPGSLSGTGVNPAEGHIDGSLITEGSIGEVKVIEPFKWVEQMPEFPEGPEAMYNYLKRHLNYPSIARENGIEGIVLVQFVIHTDGLIRNVKIARGIGGGCDQEAVRVVSSMPNWRPGKHNGVAVPVFFTLPIKYKLTK